MSELLYDVTGGVARVVLNRPERRNALTASLAGELLDALRRAEDPAVRVVVLSGAGGAFCSGSDLRENFGDGAPPSDVTLRAGRHPLLLALRALPKPVVCAVEGAAAGIGVGLALAGDLIVAGRGASFHLAFARIGLTLDGGTTWMLQRSIGRARALRAGLLGEAIDAETAAAWGLISHCVDDDELTPFVDALAAELAAGPTAAYALTKRAFDAAPVNGYAEQLELEAQLQGRAARGQDFAEGRAAFLERRPAHFEGR